VYNVAFMIIENERIDGLPPIDYEKSDASPRKCGLTFVEHCEMALLSIIDRRNGLIKNNLARKVRMNL